jgi:hypothetical protein
VRCGFRWGRSVRAYGGGLVPELREKCGWSDAVRQCPQGTQRFLGAAREASYHLVGINTNAFQLGDELSDNFRVRHPAPDWGWRRRSYIRRLLGGDATERTAGSDARKLASGNWRWRVVEVVGMAAATIRVRRTAEIARGDEQSALASSARVLRQ